MPEKKTLYDRASKELKEVLDAASAEVETWEPWQRSIPAVYREPDNGGWATFQ